MDCSSLGTYSEDYRVYSGHIYRFNGLNQFLNIHGGQPIVARSRPPGTYLLACVQPNCRYTEGGYQRPLTVINPCNSARLSPSTGGAFQRLNDLESFRKLSVPLT